MPGATENSDRGWRRFVFGPLAGRTALGLAFLLALPFCFTGLFMDDYLHQLLLAGHVGAAGDRWHLFTFVSGVPAETQPFIENGPYPWWTLPTLHFSFARPLTGLLANVEHVVVGSFAPALHLHSIVWGLALVWVVTTLYRRLALPTAVVGLATVLFAIDDAHAIPVGWVANRNALVATTFGLAAVVAHLRWRVDGWRPGVPVSVGCAALGLAAGEPALGALAYLGAWELTLGPGGLRGRARALVPMALVGLVYVALYRWSGSGAYGSEIYSDPVREPLAFLARAPAKALALTGAQFLGATADLWLLKTSVRPALVLAGVVALLLVGWMLRRVWLTLTDEARGSLRWMLLGSALSVVPVLATFPLNRLLLMPSVGASVVVSVLLVHGWRAASRRLRLGARLLFVPAVVQCVVAWPANAVAYRLGADFLERASLDTPLTDAQLAGDVVVLLAPDPATALYPPLVRLHHGRPRARSWVSLSMAGFPHRVTRRSARELELEVVGGRMLESVFEQLMRSSAHPVPLGHRVRLARLEVEVIGLDEGLPNRLRVTFDEPPEASDVTLGQWVDGRLVALTLPQPGEVLTFPKPTGLLSF